MASSRIFIRNLPPSLSEDEFKNHFSNGCQVTDSRFLRHRRIGYVGYKSHEDAANAVKHFNKSFIRMSRISVELARPVFDETLSRDTLSRDTLSREPLKSKRGDKKQTVPINANAPPEPKQQPLLKRKRDAPQEEEADPRLKEFLNVMQAPSKVRTWQNEATDGMESVPIVTSNINTNPSIRKEEQAKEEEDDELQTIGKRKKTVGSSGSKFNDINQDYAGEEAPEESLGDAMKSIPPSGLVQEQSQSQSDNDWLRSRTSRLLHLDETGEDNEGEGDEDSNADVSMSKANDDTKSDAIDDDDNDYNDQNDNEPTSSEQHEVETKAPDPSEANPDAEILKSQGRLYLRNLPYSITEDELRECFASFGTLLEVHVPMNSNAGVAKGFAYILFSTPEDAVRAHHEMDGKTFQGRLIHILPAAPKREQHLDEYAISKLPLKQQMKIRRKMESSSSTHKWNPLYMNMDDVMSSISTRMGVEKSQLLDPTASDSAVKQALAETHVIQEAKSYFSENGVDLDTFRPGTKRGDTAILVKNFPYGTKVEELQALFSEYGKTTRILIPPSGTMALIEFATAPEGRAAFEAMKYRRIKNSILFLEKAPKDVFTTVSKPLPVLEQNAVSAKLSTADLLQETVAADGIETSTLFVRNLNFSTTTETLRQAFAPISGFMSAKVKTKPDPKHSGNILSMGFGFLEFRSKDQAQAALAAMNGHVLEGYRLDVRPSQRALDAGEERRKEDRNKALAGRQTKIIVKNLPFEASKKEVRALFGAYGQLRSVRVPKKLDSSARGFAFAEFTTAREAANAMAALKNTHLLGRRLNLEYASEDVIDAEEEIEKMQKKVGSQMDKVALQRLTGSGRKKFSVTANEQDQI